MRLTEEQVAAIRTTDAAWVTRNDSYGNTWRVVDLLDTLDATRAGWDIETRMRMDAMAERDSALARAEAAEAKLDEQIEAAIALRHDLDTLRDLYGAAEARIAAALEWLRGTHPARVSYALAALVEPVGEPPREVFGVPRNAAADDALTERLDAIKDAERGVGDPQRPTCAKCGDLGDVYSVDASPRGVIGRVRCPSCAPTESDPT